MSVASWTDDGPTVLTLDCPPSDQVDQASESKPRHANPSPVGSFKSILWISAWMALVTGGVEGAYWLFRQQVFGEMLFMHPNFLWMGPLTHLVVFLLPGIGLAAISRKTGSPTVLPVAVALLSLIAALDLLLILMRGLHFWGWMLLACGLAATAARLFEKYTKQCVLLAQRTTPWLIFLLLAIGLSQEGLSRYREASAVATVPHSAKGAPNVLLVVLDTLRADALGLYGADVEIAPNLARIAEQGVVFDQAWSTAPWTLPSQAGMFTGRLPHEISADWLTKLDSTHPTLAQALSEQGWLTGGFVGNTRYCSVETGLDRGFSRYEGYRYSWGDFVLCTALGRKLLCSNLPAKFGLYDLFWRKRAPEINASLLQWLDRRDQRPYFAFLNYWDAHDPYFAPPDFRRYEPKGLEENLLLRNWWWLHKEGITENEVKMLRNAYQDCIAALDHQFGLLMDELRRRGELQNTLIIITADHGEHFGDHDLYLHGNSLYQSLIHVPLIVSWPEKIPSGKRVNVPVSLQGLPATVMELLGQRGAFPGKSWVGTWDADASEALPPGKIMAEIASQAGFPPCHGRSPVAAGPMKCARVGSMKYILNGDGTEELYNLKQDPAELVNLATDSRNRETIQRLFAD